MTRKNKQEIRRSRRRRLQSIVGGAAAVAAPLFGNTTVADAELIEYTAEIDITSVFNLSNTVAGDTVFFSGNVETDNLVEGSEGFWEVPFESFQYHVDGSSTEVFEGSGVTLEYNSSTGDLNFDWDWDSPYSTYGEFHPNGGYLMIRGTGPDTFTSFHPSGLPVAFDFTKIFRTNFWQDQYLPGYCSPSFQIWGDVVSLSGPAVEPPPPPPPIPCIVGDADCDGFVDIGGDLLPAFTNFTGPGSFGMTRAQGDVHGPVEAGDDPDGYDGDVDVSDLLTMFGNFTGPPPDQGGLVAADAGDPNIPDLVYDPTTGEVVLDVDGSGIIGYVLKNGTSSFVAGSHMPILGGVTTSLSSELSEAAFSSSVGQNSVGFVFPTGLDLAGLSSLLSINEVSRSLGAPVVPFDLVVLGPAVPEPSTAILAATAGLAGLLALRKRRRGGNDNLTV